MNANRQNNPKQPIIQQEQFFVPMQELVAKPQSADTQGMKTVDKSNNEQEIQLETAGLCLSFVRVGDRFQLRVSIDGALFLEVAVESDNQAWPAAPPLQQLHQQILPTGPVVLGVGAAGTTHWSASFAAREPGVVWCEYAARVSRTWAPQSEWLGTSFRIGEGWDLSLGQNELTLANQSRKVLLQTLGPESQLTASCSDSLELAPAKDFVQRTNTIQWRLGICLE